MLNQRRSVEDQKNIVEQGFTLVELLIVIVILGILAGIVVFAVGNLTGSSNVGACKTEAKTFETAFNAYKAYNNGTAVTGAKTIDKIDALNGADSAHGGPYLNSDHTGFKYLSNAAGDGGTATANPQWTWNGTIAVVTNCA